VLDEHLADVVHRVEDDVRVAAHVGREERLADDLEREALAAVEDRARAVGVKAAVPLGLCLLPAFLLLGIVPLVASLVTGLEW
jgi:pilus assembly protein TadC